jgi:hypothetical protein
LEVFLDLVVGSFSGHFFLSLGAYPRYINCFSFVLNFVHFQMASR